MAVDRSPLFASMEKRLGRELTPSEERLILLAAELIENENQPPATDAKARGSDQ